MTPKTRMVSDRNPSLSACSLMQRKRFGQVTAATTTWSFTDLPKQLPDEISTPSRGGSRATTTVDGYDVTNIHAPETVDISGSNEE